MPFPNDYLDGQTLIEVRLPIPADLEPQEIMHIADDGTRERYLKGFRLRCGGWLRGAAC